MFKNPNEKKFNMQIGSGPQKDPSYSSKNLNPIYQRASIYDSKTQRQEFNDQKFKTLYGFNKPGNYHNYHYKKNFFKENRSISPNQKLVDNSQSILAAEKENHILSKNKYINI